MTAQQAAFDRIRTREEDIALARCMPRNAPPDMLSKTLKHYGLTMQDWRRALGLRRLNMESATRRSLVGAKGMR